MVFDINSECQEMVTVQLWSEETGRCHNSSSRRRAGQQSETLDSQSSHDNDNNPFSEPNNDLNKPANLTFLIRLTTVDDFLQPLYLLLLYKNIKWNNW